MFPYLMNISLLIINPNVKQTMILYIAKPIYDCLLAFQITINYSIKFLFLDQFGGQYKAIKRRFGQ